MSANCSAEFATDGVGRAVLALNEEVGKLGLKPVLAWIGFGMNEDGEPTTFVMSSLGQFVAAAAASAGPSDSEFSEAISDLLAAAAGERAASDPRA